MCSGVISFFFVLINEKFEALYIITNGISFRTGKLNNLIMNGQHGFYVNMFFEKENLSNEEIKLEFKFDGKKREYWKSGKKTDFKRYFGYLNSVCIYPRDIEMIYLSPSDRRKYFDLMISQIDRKYLDTIIPTRVTSETINLLKDVDAEGRRIIFKYKFHKDISQTIFVLFGSDIYHNGKRSVAARLVQTDDFMTVSPVKPLNVKINDLKKYKINYTIKMSWQCLDEINQNLIKKYNIGAFVLDVTDKPPATTCWE